MHGLSNWWGEKEPPVWRNPGLRLTLFSENFLEIFLLIIFSLAAYCFYGYSFVAAIFVPEFANHSIV